MDQDTVWSAAAGVEDVFEGRARSGDELRWTGSRYDFVFGSNSIPRSIVDVHAADDAQAKFVSDFCAAFAKVIDSDRFDLT